jgi:NDP-sugar pyrophosphorylase family protein
MADMVVSHFGDGENLRIKTIYARDPFPLGTAGAIRNALTKTSSKHLLVLNGDSYCRIDVSGYVKSHRGRSAQASMALVFEKDTRRYGSVKINGEGMVVSFEEKSPRRRAGLVNGGIYLFDREVLEAIPEGRMVSLEHEVLPTLIGNGLYGLLSQGPFVDIGTPESYEAAGAILRDEFEYLLQGVSLESVV